MENKPLLPYRPPESGDDLNNIKVNEFRDNTHINLSIDKARQLHLSQLKATAEELKRTKSKAIIFQEPLISLGEIGVIYPNTVTLVQGATGVHKSRLVQGICSLIISRLIKSFLGFFLKSSKYVTLCYLDTERNIKDQYPYALQDIQTHAGYDCTEHPVNFEYSSFITIPRKDRLQALEDYVHDLRQRISGHLFIVLDVISDLIGDFNRVEESMKCMDWMNKMINEQDISFLAIIHENPGGEKARGHLGTELLNKVTTAIQIAFEKGLEDQGIFRVSFKKNRNSHRLGHFNVRYSENIKGLEIVSNDEVTESRGANAEKAPLGELVEFLAENIPSGGMFGKDLIPLLMSKFDTTDKTARERLNTLIDVKKQIPDNEGKVFYLHKHKLGQNICYMLKLN